MLRRDALQQPLELHGFIHCCQRAAAVLQRDLELARGIFGHHRAGGQALRIGRIQHVAEQGREVVEARETVGLDALTLPCTGCIGAGRRVAAIWLCFQQIELHLAGKDHAEAALLQPLLGASETVPRVRCCGAAIELVHREHHLARARQPGRGPQGARHRPAQFVGVTAFPDQPGGLHIRTRHIQAEDGSGHIATGGEQRIQFVTAHGLATRHTGGIGEHELHRVDVGMLLKELRQFCAHVARIIGANSCSAASKASRNASTCALVVTGDASIMLWKGVSRNPLFSRYRCSAPSSS